MNNVLLIFVKMKVILVTSRGLRLPPFRFYLDLLLLY